jgi:hypothetical protein
MDRALLALFSLASDSARTYRGAAWQRLPDRLLLPQSLVTKSLASVGTLVVALPIRDSRFIYELFLVSRGLLQNSALVKAKPPFKEGVFTRVYSVLFEKPTHTGWRWPPVPNALPFPLLEPPADPDKSITLDLVTRALALSMQATAEWLVYEATPEAYADVALRQDLLAQYATNEVRAADAFFSMLVLPFTSGARPEPNATAAHTALAASGYCASKAPPGVFLWKNAASTETMKTWVRAGIAMTSTFVAHGHTCDADMRALRLGALEQHAASFGDRLPATALAWMQRSRDGSAAAPLMRELLAEASGDEGEQLVRAFQHMRADVGRWCVASAPLSALPGNIAWAAEPFIQVWNKALAESYEGTPAVTWGAVALQVAQHSLKPVLLRATIERMEEAKKVAQLHRVKTMQYYKSIGRWLYPDFKDPMDGVQRLAEVRATSYERLMHLLVSTQAHANIPECVRFVMTRGRREHHLVRHDRWILARWLISLQPRSLTPFSQTAEKLRVLADFAFGMDVCETPKTYQEAVEEFVGNLAQAVKHRMQKKQHPNQHFVMCEEVIKHTLKPPDTRYACRCPHAALRAPSQKFEKAYDVKPCVTACAAAAGPSVPTVYRPLDRILWAKETGREASLSSKETRISLDW